MPAFHKALLLFNPVSGTHLERRTATVRRVAEIFRRAGVEAVSLSLAGGFMGVAAGIGISRIIAAEFHWTTLVQPDVIAIAVGFSAAVGIVFGMYPATRASRLDPIEALRFE